MNEKKDVSLVPVYLILGAVGTSLILTGALLGVIFSYFSVEISNEMRYFMQTVFILSGLGDFALILYAKNKLANK